MTLVVETPPGFDAERDYIFGVILEDFLGLEWRRVTTEREDVRITIEADSRRAVNLPDVFFSMPEAHWLTIDSIPASPLEEWDSRATGVETSLVDPVLPVIFGTPLAKFANGDVTMDSPIDIFGSAFFMLTRYEELVLDDRDDHDRFPSSASLAARNEFLDRPIVDEYVELLWSLLSGSWPQLTRRRHSFSFRLSHDVDRPARYQFGSGKRLLRACAGDMLKRGEWLAPLTAARVRLGRNDRLNPADPFNTFDWIMDVSERHGLRSAFYFICGRTHPELDANYEPDQPAIRALMRRIHERGHEIGLHPSYNTYRDPERLTEEADRLRTICTEEGIHQSEWGGRMHYLRWDQVITPVAWNAAGMAYDSTLGYADHAGFRCGTCHEYPAYDVHRRSVLSLRLRPLIAMDCSILDHGYMGLNDAEALDYIIRLRDRARLMNGGFSLLWHNSELVDNRSRRIYSEVTGTAFGTI